MVYNFLSSLPCKRNPDDKIDLAIRKVSRLDRDGLCSNWHKQVQPIITADRRRVDREWSWPLYNIVLRLAAPFRSPRLFQLAVGRELRPAAMIALLATERWIDEIGPAVFLWYLAAAPDSCLEVTTRAGRLGFPGLVGLAGIDTALVVSLRSEARGRLWLHADPSGGADLRTWYGVNASASRIPEGAFDMLPGDVARGGRHNEGGYFAFTHETALWAYRRLSKFRV